MLTKAERKEVHAAYLRCRTLGHAWDDVPVEEKPPFGDPMWFRCMRCLTERRDYIGTSGDLVGRRYVYPEGYQGYWKYGDVNPTMEDFRTMLLVQRIKDLRAARKTTKEK